VGSMSLLSISLRGTIVYRALGGLRRLLLRNPCLPFLFPNGGRVCELPVAVAFPEHAPRTARVALFVALWISCVPFPPPRPTNSPLLRSLKFEVATPLVLFSIARSLDLGNSFFHLLVSFLLPGTMMIFLMGDSPS